MLRITPTHLHWIGSEPQRDLCAHAGIRVSIGEELFIIVEDKDLAVSTGALHLLRTLRSDHTPEAPVAEHLVPHCGHFMVVDEETGETFNIGCDSGANWWVRHEGDAVVLVREDGVEYRTVREAWVRAVTEFSDAVAAFFAESPARQPFSREDATWFQAFRAEWDRLRSPAALPASFTSGATSPEPELKGRR